MTLLHGQKKIGVPNIQILSLKVAATNLNCTLKSTSNQTIPEAVLFSGKIINYPSLLQLLHSGSVITSECLQRQAYVVCISVLQ